VVGFFLNDQLTTDLQNGGEAREEWFAAASLQQPGGSGAGRMPVPRWDEVGSLSGTQTVGPNTLGLATFTNLTIDQTGSRAVQFACNGPGLVESHSFVVSP
jgi:hypothetical protein